MIAIDANILVYAHRQDSSWHARAAECVKQLAGSNAPWAIPWPCIHEFLAIATHPRIYDPASSIEAAVERVEAWMESPSLLLLTETEGHWSVLRQRAQRGQIIGPKIHDTRVATLCMTHGIRELWSADRDFSRFPDLRTKNPLLPQDCATPEQENRFLLLPAIHAADAIEGVADVGVVDGCLLDVYMTAVRDLA